MITASSGSDQSAVEAMVRTMQSATSQVHSANSNLWNAIGEFTEEAAKWDRGVVFRRRVVRRGREG